MEEIISITGPTDFKEILILTFRIGVWKNKLASEASRILYKFKHQTARIFASMSIFYSTAYHSDFLFRIFFLGGGGGWLKNPTTNKAIVFYHSRVASYRVHLMCQQFSTL